MNNLTVSEIEAILAPGPDDDGWGGWADGYDISGAKQRYADLGHPEPKYTYLIEKDGVWYSKYSYGGYSYSGYRSSPRELDKVEATPEEIEQFKIHKEWSNGFWEFYKILSKEEKYVEVPGLGRVSLVESFGGEGQGDQYWFVLKISNGDSERHFKMNGWYASHDGGHYDGPFVEVKPVQKVVTFFE